jgi:hypothetical protein
MNNEKSLTEIISEETTLKRERNYSYGRCTICHKGLMKIWNSFFYCSFCTPDQISKEQYLAKKSNNDVYPVKDESVLMEERNRFR